MERSIILTADGSHTITVPSLNATYHSVFGAIQESRHVYIEAGLIAAIHQHPFTRVLEMGFGTGLNALLTLLEAEKRQLKVDYTAIELHPLSPGEAEQLNYCQLLDSNALPLFIQMHKSPWEIPGNISPNFNLIKLNVSIENFSTPGTFNLIYYDAFAPSSQPELWTNEIFEKLYSLLEPGGMMVTYCSKGDVRRALINAGFKVEKLPGPKGKREMLRGIKNSSG